MHFNSTKQNENQNAILRQRQHWLTKERVQLYSRVFLLTEIFIAIVLALLAALYPKIIGPDFIANDFRVFWSASHLSLSGHAIDVYDFTKFFPAQQVAEPELQYSIASQYWLYPPTFLLAISPLALLPYMVSYIAFVTAGVLLYLYVVRRIIPYPFATLAALGFFPVLIASVTGQNSFITVSLAGLALIWLESQPVLAGIAIGMLVIKPQLAVLFVVALFFSRQWKAILSAAASCISFIVISTSVIGSQSIPAFFKNLTVAKELIEKGFIPWQCVPTNFINALLVGASTTTANLIQILTALFSACTVAYLWCTKSSSASRNSALVIGNLLISPYLLIYDLIWLALPIAWMTSEGIRNGWKKGEREILAIAWLTPILNGLVSLFAKFHIAPLILIAMLGMLLIRQRTPHDEFSWTTKLTKLQAQNKV